MGVDTVAPDNVPSVATQLYPGVICMAALQLSFDGCANTNEEAKRKYKNKKELYFLGRSTISFMIGKLLGNYNRIGFDDNSSLYL